jgi:hypothetical protein
MVRPSLLVVLVALPAMGQGYPISSRQTLTQQRIAEYLIGEDFTMESLVLTENNPASVALAIMGGKLCLFSTSPSCFYYDRGTGLFTFGAQIKNALGGNLLTDFLMSAQQDRPVAFSETRGFRHLCQAALVGTCGTGTIVEGTQQCLSATLTSRTRYCTCTSNGAASPTYAWVNTDGDVGDTTTCPEITP